MNIERRWIIVQLGALLGLVYLSCLVFACIRNFCFSFPALFLIAGNQIRNICGRVVPGQARCQLGMRCANCSGRMTFPALA